ncbi:2-octaprenyl-6-methoxyphenyl hydroxylase [Thalassotalea litorea]|uniref:2-octaprenyl-6-methoxyphenyl hydroxylase n=1 Tax=Thalassotalea litorea TaxID=2020715 RepID=A0A5R9INH2_9GAMM|nr:2-octaprenyl-6-methoxyphenyl hydroxylase [Thalassotalea litorea]TLU66822.1 2-octaprenyl-6-methoxyphenyl hydroxylase [Thalassotalea litorea]
MAANQAQYDIVISGGGLTGAAMALAVLKQAKKPLQVAIVDSANKQQASGGFDERVIALSYGSAEYLHKLGVWDRLKSHACAIKNIHVSDRTYYGKARIDCQDYQREALGYVAPLDAIAKSIYAELKTLTGGNHRLDEYFANGIEDIVWQKNEVQVQLQQGQLLTAKLLLGCDGGQSRCRQIAKIDTECKDYQQYAIVANVQTTLPHNNKAFERFTKSGPLAMLPMTENRCSLVWTLTPSDAEYLMSMDDVGFANALQKAFGDWLGPFTRIGRRQNFPLQLVHAMQLTQHRLALLGNASHTLHPIAGQGFNLSVRDVACLASLITKALENGDDLGSYDLLSRYQQLRQEDQQTIIRLTDSLVHCFSNQYFPLVVGRNVGLKALNYSSGIKRLLAQTTMGYVKE